MARSTEKTASTIYPLLAATPIGRRALAFLEQHELTLVFDSALSASTGVTVLEPIARKLHVAASRDARSRAAAVVAWVGEIRGWGGPLMPQLQEIISKPFDRRDLDQALARLSEFVDEATTNTAIGLGELVLHSMSLETEDLPASDFENQVVSIYQPAFVRALQRSAPSMDDEELFDQSHAAGVAAIRQAMIDDVLRSVPSAEYPRGENFLQRFAVQWSALQSALDRATHGPERASA